MDKKRISVIGGGTMGNGIAQVFATSGFHVTLIEAKTEFAERAIATIEKNLGRMVAREKITADQSSEALDRIAISTDIAQGVSDAELVIEAVPELPDLKRQIFEKVNLHAPSSAVIATNTSSISVTKLASWSGRADRFIGMHFFNPVPIMKLVEVINGHDTAPEVTKLIVAISEKLGKVPVTVNDSPGFVSNRVLMPMINEAIFCLYEGVATAEAVDQVMKLGMAHPMGPLRLADFIGLDVCLDILNVLYEGFRDPKYRPCPLLVKKVEAGKLGDKTGEGFFSYPAK